MNLWQSIRMAFQTLLAKKARSILTMLGTVIGVTAVISLVSVTKAQNEANRSFWMKMSQNMVEVYFYSYEWQGGMPNSAIARELKAYINEDLKDMTRGVTPNASEWDSAIRWGGRDSNSRLYYGSEQFSLVQQCEIESGRDICYIDIQRANNVCVIGSMLRTALFNYRDPIGETIYIKNQPFTVVGVYRERVKQPDYYTDDEWMRWSEDNMLVVPYTASRIINPSMEMNNYQIKVDDNETGLEVKGLLEDFLGSMITRFDWEQWSMDNPGGGYADTSGSNGDYSVYFNPQWIEDTEKAEESQTRTLSLIAAISLVVGGIGIMNIMLVTVTERTREIGVRKAIGAPRRTIITQFLIEAVVMSGLGGVLGVIFGFAVTLYWGKLQYGLIASPDLPITAVAFIGSLAMGIIFGIYPAIKAASLQPVDALRTD